ncbi:hypothetical protein DL765_011625 [Monosporascus sp. GIB2]|nr:hypothetical protein DL765_011625 [Monosporascus sp. GIB2]
MDPLSVTASIVAILQLTSKAIEYLHDVKDASKDRARCAIEASNLYSLLVTLRFRLEEGNANEPWCTSVRALGVENGPLDQYRQALEELQPKTTGGSGIKKMANTLMWKFSKDEVTLFCPGIPGAGKTMVAAIAIDHLLGRMQSNTIGVAYIYCSYKAQADQTTTSLLAAILKQLAQARPSVADPVARLYNHHADRRTRPSLEEIINALRSVLTNYSSVYVVVDALDECAYEDGTRNQLLATLRDLQSETDMHLMLTSRLIPDIENEFRSMPTLKVRASGADVKRFVLGQVYRLPKCVQRDDELQGFAQDKIVEAVDGMFLLARLHVDSLLDKRTKSKDKSTLENLSKGSKALDKAYDEAMKRIDSQLPEDRALAKNVLSWITYAQRPLTTGELCHALAVEPGEDELDRDNIPDVEDIVSVCAGLVTVDRESNIIRLVHYTTQDYFERIREYWNPSAQQEIASTCLSYLSLGAFRSGSCPSDEDFEDRIEQYSFLDYAARYWEQHAITVQKEVSELALSLLQHSNLVSSVVQMSVFGRVYRYPGDSQDFPTQTTGLHLTARFGLLYFSEKLLHGSGNDIIISADSKDGHGRTPLSYAAERGYEAVVKQLVERKDVEADSKDK